MEAREPSSSWASATLVVVAALLLAAATLPTRLVAAGRLAEQRWLLGAAGSAILIGVVAAGLAH